MNNVPFTVENLFIIERRYTNAMHAGQYREKEDWVEVNDMMRSINSWDTLLDYYKKTPEYTNFVKEFLRNESFKLKLEQALNDQKTI